MSPKTSWPPGMGEPLPRAAEAYAAPEKLEWILSTEGHGPEWARVLHIGRHDASRLWSAIANAVPGRPIHKVANPHGTVCGVEMTIEIGNRSANACTVWHYKHANDVPRLVTAYPRL